MLGSGQPVESLVQEPATIKRQCLIYQKRIAWAAFRTEIIYVVLLRPLELKEWNKYVPNGDWHVDHKQVYRSAQPPSIRRGIVQSRSTTAAADASSSPSSTTRDPFVRNSQIALSLLPAEVQAHANQVLSQTASSTLSGESSAHSDVQDRVFKENVRLLVVAGDQALVIRGQREISPSASDTAESSRNKLSRQDWFVQQYTYSLSSDPSALAADKRKGIVAR